MLTIYVNATQRYFRAQKEVVVKYPYSYDNLKSSSSLKSMKRGRIQGELLKSARDAVQCLMDDQTGVMISKELQEIHRTTSNEMMRRTDISVRLVLDANSEVDSVIMQNFCDLTCICSTLKTFHLSLKFYRYSVEVGSVWKR